MLAEQPSGQLERLHKYNKSRPEQSRDNKEEKRKKKGLINLMRSESQITGRK
jgi:hypothetical protein